MKKTQENEINQHLHTKDRGDSVDELARLESANSFIAEKEIGQQRDNS
ncbi:hypothetical protein [Niallia taxi]|nr:hypothetical protein [Niallia taxi]MCT2343898.1 hypothetical protein [Niallia taxi]MDE5051919.1 hypothetical protein [Niallia taxi]MED3963709.1 hypothetical protein [Niallia taxi]WOD61644.1 hypothetical protein NQZ71_12520 [Niallia taxi]